MGAKKLKIGDEVIVRDWPIGLTQRGGGSFDKGARTKVQLVTSDASGNVPWYVLGDGYPYSGDALEPVSDEKEPELRIGDRVVFLEPPAGMSWKESSTYPGMGGVIVAVEHGSYAVAADGDDGESPWYFDFTAVAKDNGQYKLVDEVRVTKEDQGSPVPASTNPKQAYGDKKVPLQLCPPAALAYMAIGMREGAAKYGAWNFRESNVEVMTYVGAIMRHLYAFVDGEQIDDDASLMPKPHLAGAMASLAILIDALESGTAVDNRPPASSFSRILRDYSL